MTGIYVWVQTSHFHREKIHSTKNWRLEFEQLLLAKLPKQAKMVNRIFSKKNFPGKATFTLNVNKQSWKIRFKLKANFFSLTITENKQSLNRE